MTPVGTTHYVYDLAGQLIAEATDAGSTVREYGWLDDMPLTVVADIDALSPNLYFVHTDHLDCPLKMTDARERSCGTRCANREPRPGDDFGLG
jgi:YD repeat-containing protein